MTRHAKTVVLLLPPGVRWFWVRASVVGIALLMATIAGFAYLGYRQDVAAAKRRVASGSTLMQTACGPIEYAERGQGSAVLLVHGAGGGFDQGLGIAEDLARAGFRVVT